VVTIDEPEQVLDVARRLRPDLVITMHPTLLRSGRCVTQVVRADATLAGTPVLSLASWVRASELARAAEAGVTESLSMPVALPVLLEAVQRLIMRTHASPAGEP
jgi:CheY-like chemotaxis protein